ncbi:mfs general substrate transporter [Lichtheimia corymbifera JMRC:FSU:9682]|uniref:Mfs general substrate transporter n=1 Tax=Lichtheimia corymbifera JMRC:FSU:9682 TaxID=1263082 RepID=A0A068SAH6_9FUNG|nr:mfs general substrate transporter [Lichtheimia corymbifera JMRC:FSU:9682]
MIALSAVALVGSLIQAHRYDTIGLYVLVCIAAICLLIEGAVNCSLESQGGSYADAIPRVIAGYLLGPLFPAIAWVVLMESFRGMVDPATAWHDSLPGDMLGTFMWAFLLVSWSIACIPGLVRVPSPLTESALSDIMQTPTVTTYGLWGFLPLYVYRQIKRWNVCRPLIRSFAVFVTLVFLVTIGRNIFQAIIVNDIEGSHAMAAQVVDFVTRIFGIICLYWVIAFGHTWRYNHVKVASYMQPFYDEYLLSPRAQVCLLGLVFLLGPGMSNALNSIIAHRGNVNVMDASYGLLYACFALVGFVAGSVTNKLGVRWTIAVGVLGYLVHASSQWAYDTRNVSGYLIAASAIFGCCAGLLWSAQGAVMMSYPEEKDKGKSIAIFWAIYNIGTIIGSIILLGRALDEPFPVFSENGVYVAFIVIMVVGLVVTRFMVASPSRIIRSDNTKVVAHKAGSWKNELIGVLHVCKDWRIIALIPAFFASDFGTMYQSRMMVSSFEYSHPPTYHLNATMVYLFQILGSVAIGLFLDYQKHTRRIRALSACAILYIMIMAVWGGGIAFQLKFVFDSSGLLSPESYYTRPIRWDDPGYGGPLVLCIFYGLTGGMYQSFMYWLMGAMSNDPKVLSRYAGFYKGAQLAGVAVSYGVLRSDILLRWQCLISWIILIISFPGIFLVANRVTESNLTEEDLADKEAVDFDNNTFGSARNITEDVVDEAVDSHSSHSAPEKNIAVKGVVSHGNPSLPDKNNHHD